MTFDKWFYELTSNYVWAQPAMLHHKPETFRQLANKVYMDFLAGNGVKSMEDCRRHVYNLVCKTPGDNKKVDWVGKALEKLEVKKEEWIPVTGEERQRRLAEYKAIIDSMPMVNNFPRLTEKERADNDWNRKKDPPYPSTTPMEYYLKERHLQYIIANYDARTREPLPGWTTEEQFNLEFDSKHLTDKGL